MFGSGADSGHNNSGIARTVLIPTRFVWPHGGQRVVLSGSFTGWSEHILMSPMEGCTTVFQVICNLTPGYHQYKFNVDGEWCHDEHQPFVSGSYGIVNTVFLARESNVVPGIFTPGRSNMEVDDATCSRMTVYCGRRIEDFFDCYLQNLCPLMVTSSDGVLREALPRISEADVVVSRQRISLFLSQHTAYELLPDSGKVVALDVNLPVKQAFHILYEQGIPIAPLWDFCKGNFVGVLSAIDFILILRELGNHGSNLTKGGPETHTILAWKDRKSRLNRSINGNGERHPRRIIHAGPYDSLEDVALKILQNKISTVPVIHSSSPDGSFPQLLHLASLSGILKCICRHFKYSTGSLPILQQPICSIPLGTWVPKIGESSAQPFAILRQNASLSAALSMLVQAEVSSVPIVDDNHSLIDIYSRSDITSLAKDEAYAQIHLDTMSIHQVLQLTQEANSSCGVYNGKRCQMCLPSDSLHKVMQRLANPGVRRLVIVEAGSKRVEGIITLSDIFRFLLG